MGAAAEPDLDGFERWLIEQRLRSEGTARLYAADVRACVGHPRGPLGFLGDRARAPNTRRHHLAAMRAFAKYTSAHDLLAELDKDNIRLPPAERVREAEPLADEDWRALMDALAEAHMDPVLQAACGLVIHRGIRVGDVCRLGRARAEAALRSGVLVLSAKGERQLRYTVDPIQRWVEQLVADERPWELLCEVLSRRAKDPFRAARLRIYRQLERLADDVGVDDVHPHRLRRSYAVAYYRACGKDLELLRQHMGWANIATAARYIDHARREELDSIADDMMRKIRQ